MVAQYKKPIGLSKTCISRFYRPLRRLYFLTHSYDFAAFRLGLTTSLNLDFVNHFWGGILKDFDHTSEYGRIRTPVLVLAGRYDFGAPYFLWEEVGKIILDYTFYLFEAAGHNPMLELPKEFDQILIGWMQSKN